MVKSEAEPLGLSPPSLTCVSTQRKSDAVSCHFLANSQIHLEGGTLNESTYHGVIHGKPLQNQRGRLRTLSRCR